MTVITATQIRDILNYDPETGKFTWKKKISSKVVIGRVAGTNVQNGYSGISIYNKRYYSHRLAWLHFYGLFPDGLIDHIDGDKQNNSIANLRSATPSENSQNTRMRCDNTVGMKGVSYSTVTPGRPFRAYVCRDGKRLWLGYFRTAGEAQAAYWDAARGLFGEFANKG
jgi:hypothetical protein